MRDTATSPRDTVRLTTAQALARFLQGQWSERDGVRRRVIPGVFGIFGHGNLLGLGQALEEEGTDLPFYQGKNEQAMVHVAIGYAKASNRLSTLACTASIGPGSTNMVTGAATATINRLPVLLLAADTFANRRQGPVLQQLEHPAAGDVSVNDCLRPVSRFFDRVARPEQLLTALPDAMRVLLDPADTGAVTLALHQDVQGEAYDFPASFFAPRIWHVARRPPADEEISAAVELLRRSSRPFIVAGGGVHYSGATAELAELSERFGVPVGETFAGKGALPRGGLLLGGIGATGTGAANALARSADVVVCVGTRLSDFTTGSHSLFQHPEVGFVGINVCGADAVKLGATPVVADARLALAALVSALNATRWSTDSDYRDEARVQRQRWSDAVVADLAPREGERMSQGQVLALLNENARPGDIIVAAAGTPPADVHKLWDCGGGASCHLEFGYSCMAHEIPSALGIRMARPDAGEIYVVIGDGTYLMGNTELVTGVQEGLKITVVLVENGGFQSIRGLQVAKTGLAFGTEFRRRNSDDGRLSGDVVRVDYAANARSLGCAVFEIDSPEELRHALAAARAESRLSAIIAHVEPHRLLLDSECWWDVGVAQVSGQPQVRELSAEHARAATAQRFYY